MRIGRRLGVGEGGGRAGYQVIDVVDMLTWGP